MKRHLFLIGLCALLLCQTSVVASEQELQLVTPTGTIYGTLALPESDGPVPVALIIAGSGPTDRNGNSALLPTGNDSLKLLAEALSEAGFASVRYDKRGIAASAAAGPQEADLRFEHYVDDAAAWVKQLAADARFSGVAIVGHSEGALIGTLAAAQTQVPLVSIAGAADAAGTLIRRQLAGRLPADLAANSEGILASLEIGQTIAQVPSQLVSIFRPSVQPYLVSWFKYRPTDELAKITTPCLILQGTTDIQVTWSDAETLHAANGACDMHIIGGMNHIMKAVPDDVQQQIASYRDPALPLEPKLTVILVDFLHRSFPREADAP